MGWGEGANKKTWTIDGFLVKGGRKRTAEGVRMSRLTILGDRADRPTLIHSNY